MYIERIYVFDENIVANSSSILSSSRIANVYSFDGIFHTRHNSGISNLVCARPGLDWKSNYVQSFVDWKMLYSWFFSIKLPPSWYRQVVYLLSVIDSRRCLNVELFRSSSKCLHL